MKFAVIQFPGSNCDHDFIHAVEDGIDCDASLVWHRESSLGDADVVVVPGGFSYGDYLRAGAIARFSPVMDAVIKFANDGGPVIGICNGFQILTESGLLPGALAQNASMKFVCKDTLLKVATADSFVTNELSKDDIIKIPVAHMEGRYTTDDATIDQLRADDRILFQYCDSSGAVTDIANPNGSMGGIAGILSKNRNVAGMMPHPERVYEASLGGTDGLHILKSIVSTVSKAS